MSILSEQMKIRLGSFLGWFLTNCLCRTLRLRTVGYENVEELVESGKGFIMAIWHGRTMVPVYNCRGMGIWAITSLSRDGEIQTGIVSRFGYRTIRGSSGRGGMKAALIAAKKLQEGGILSITPDGPKGPFHEIHDGIVFLAERAGCPIIPLGVAANPSRILGAWDCYMVPKPFSKCAIVFGSPIDLAVLKSSSGETDAKRVIQDALDACERQAEEMVGDVR